MKRLLELVDRADLALDLDEIGLTEALWLATQLDSAPEAPPIDELERTDDSADSNSPDVVEEAEVQGGTARPSGTTHSTAASTEPSAAASVGTEGADLAAARNVGALTVRLPGVAALPGATEIQRALRPFKRRVPSRVEFALDEEATVEHYADTGVLLPIPRSLREPWLEVALVVDEHESMVVWRETVEELTDLLVRLGGFRDIRRWGLTSDGDGTWITRGAEVGKASRGVRRPPWELIDPLGRRLILVVSDCTGPGWHSGAFVSGALRRWAAAGPAAIVQVLPRRLWERTGLAVGRPVGLSSREAGVANRLLDAVEQTRALRPPEATRSRADQILLPVVTLEEGSVGAWAALVSGRGEADGRRFAAGAQAARAEPPVPLTAADRVKEFRRFASPTAKRLAGFFAATPSLQLPLLRVVQRVMLPESRQSHLAEVVLGGLMRRVSPDEAPPSEIEYAFHDDEVRELLLNFSMRNETVQVLEEVSLWLERQRGVRTGFRAALVGRSEGLGEDEQPFARVTAAVLRRLGGEFDELAERIESPGTQRPGTSGVSTETATVSGDLDVEPESKHWAKGGSTLLPGTTRDFGHLVNGLSAEFVGRDELLHTLKRFIQSENGGLFNIVAPDGWGKSSIIAKLAKDHDYVHFFYSPAADPAVELATLFRHTTVQVTRRFGLEEALPLAEWVAKNELPSDAESFTSFLALAAAASTSPIVILWDGLCETPEARLPLSRVPDGVVLVVTRVIERDPGVPPSGKDSLTYEISEREQLDDIRRFLEETSSLSGERIADAARSEAPTSFLLAALASRQYRSEVISEVLGSEPEGRGLMERTWAFFSDRLNEVDRHLLAGVARSQAPVRESALRELAFGEDVAAKSQGVAALIDPLQRASELGLVLIDRPALHSGDLPAQPLPGATFSIRHESIRRLLIEQLDLSTATAASTGRRIALLVSHSGSPQESLEEYTRVKREQDELGAALAQAGFEIQALVEDQVSWDNVTRRIYALSEETTSHDVIWLHLAGPGETTDAVPMYELSPLVEGPRVLAIPSLVEPLLEADLAALVLTVEGGDGEYRGAIEIVKGDSHASVAQMASEQYLQEAGLGLVSHAVIRLLGAAAADRQAVTLASLVEGVASIMGESGAPHHSTAWEGDSSVLLADFADRKGSEDVLPALFLSYVTEDRERAVQLRDQLDNAGIRTSLHEDIDPGAEWAEVIQRDIEESDLFVALVSKAALQSSSTRAEWDAATDAAGRHGGFKQFVFPVLLEKVNTSEAALFFARVPSEVTRPGHWFQWLEDDFPPQLVDEIRAALEESRPDVGSEVDEETAGTPFQAPGALPEGRIQVEVMSGRGEAMLFRWPGPSGRVHSWLIDGGGPGAYKKVLRPRLEELTDLSPDGGPVNFDVVVLTHMDDDQSNGILKLFEDENRRVENAEEPLVSIQDFWFNTRGATEEVGESLRPVIPEEGRERRLAADLQKLQVPRNLRQSGGDLVADPASPPRQTEAGGARVWILSPTSQRLEHARRSPGADSNTMAMALLIDLAGYRILLPSDSPGEAVVEGLESHGLLDPSGRLHVDFLKLPHRGSDRPEHEEFYSRVTADNYLLTADGRHGLPRIETLERMFRAREGLDKPMTLYLAPSPEEYVESYPLEELESYLEKARSRWSDLEVVYADLDTTALVIEIESGRQS